MHLRANAFVQSALACLDLGHRIRVDVSTGNFPRYDRNTNAGGVIARETEEQMMPAINRIHHGPSHPSRLVLPIIDWKDQP